MPEVALVISADAERSLRDLAETLRYELERQDVVCALHMGGFSDPTPQRVYVLLDPWAHVRPERRAALPCDAILRRTVAVCTGPLPEDERDECVELLRCAGAVFALDQRVAVDLEREGLRARLLRPGYSERLDRFDPAAARPTDVVFAEARTARQRGYVEAAMHVLRRFDCQQQEAGDDDPRLLLARAKVMIDIHPGDDARLDWRCTVDAIHSGAVVVTEHSSGIAPLKAGEHLLVAAPDAVPYVARALLQDEPRLTALRTAAYERLRAWLPDALPVSILRAAVVELVGEPLPSARPAPVGVSAG